MSEVWKPVPGFEGLYEVSDQGSVRSLDRALLCTGAVKGTYTRYKPGRVLRPGVKGAPGHVSVALGQDAGSFDVHALVMRAFVGPRPAGMEIRHKNGVAADNRLENLEYATRSRNLQDKKWHYHRPSGYKLRPPDVIVIREKLRNGETLISIAKQHGISQSAVHAIKTGKFHRDV